MIDVTSSADAWRDLALYLRKPIADTRRSVAREAAWNALLNLRGQLSLALGALAVIAFLERLGLLPPHAAALGFSAIVGCLLMAIVLRTMLLAAKNVDVSFVAERLDFSTDQDNRIATAIDLLRTHTTSAFAIAAIEQGRVSAKNVAHRSPATVQLNHASFRSWQTLLLSLLLLGIVLLVPLPQRKVFSFQPDRAIVTQTSRIAVSTASPVERSDFATALSTTDRATPRLLGAAHSVLDAPIGRAGDAARMAMSVPGGTGASAGVMRLSDTAAASDAGNARGSDGESPGHGDAHDKHAADGASGAPTAAPSLAASAGQGSGSATEKPGESPSSGAASGQSGSSAAPTPASGAHSSSGGSSQGGQSQSSKNGSPQGQGRSVNSTGQSGQSGRSHSNTQSAPKKSRGVAPMLLETKVPDLLQGPSRPGPDRKTQTQMTPIPMPGNALADEPAATGTAPEQVHVGFQVPGEMQGTVENYFQQLHAEADDATPPRAADPGH